MAQTSLKWILLIFFFIAEVAESSQRCMDSNSMMFSQSSNHCSYFALFFFLFFLKSCKFPKKKIKAVSSECSEGYSKTREQNTETLIWQVQ